MNAAMLEYSEIDSPIHKLTGATKLNMLNYFGISIYDNI